MSGYKRGGLFRARSRSIRFMILVSFSVVSAVCTAVLGIGLYRLFVRRSQAMMMENTEQLLNQVSSNLEDYLRNMRRISDAMYYAVIKGKDIGTENIDSELDLLYEANRDELISFALFGRDGRLISAAPITVQKRKTDVTAQEWFGSAAGEMENLHFSAPHVQNLFDDPSYRYYWVISLSRLVDLTDHGRPTEGILLVDMNYSTIERMLSDVNADTGGRYVYLCDSEGELIYHPRQMQIASGFLKENHEAAVHYEDGATREVFEGEAREVVVDTVSYTGWKLVSVMPVSEFSLDLTNTRLLAILMVTTVLLAVLSVNRLVATQLSKPLMRLNDAIRRLEAGDALYPEIYAGGSTEVEHLGRTLRSYLEQINRLMRDILVEQEEKRKSELDALQSQINPHFLYNTLDSIVWMIEGERYQEAVSMVSDLANLFRISLSRGKTIIRMEDELRHAEYYMNIQKLRFKNSFTVRYEIAPEIKDYCTVKLIVQPLLENAIYYGVKDMEDDGEIVVRAVLEAGEIRIHVRDNGYGIPEETRRELLKDTGRKRGRGSGVGLLNVQRRIRLRFGERYGLHIESEPDEGTEVTIHLPAIPYTERNQSLLEEGKRPEQILPENMTAGVRSKQNGKAAGGTTGAAQLQCAAEYEAQYEAQGRGL